MMRIDLPVMQNWSCHNCGGCCRQHEIEITDAERDRILAQNWTPADGVPADQPVIERIPGWFGPARYRLAHRADGACVFLDERGLCRIHAKFGEAAKPLPCRIYPFAFHPAGKGVTVSLRFSCPSVTANLGRPISKQTSDLQEYARQVVPSGAEQSPPPHINRREQVSWPDFRRFTAALEATLTASHVSLSVSCARALWWTSLLANARFDKLEGRRIEELLELVCRDAEHVVPDQPQNVAEPSRMGHMAFRSLAAIYARKDTAVEIRSGWRGRWRLFTSLMRFFRGTGLIPVMQDGFASVPFSALETSFGDPPEEAVAIMRRYFQVKIQGLHFCGRGFYDVPFVEGAAYLVLMWPMTLWFARWLAAGDGRSAITVQDLTRALNVADHNQGFTPLLGQSNARQRVRYLHTSGDLAKFAFWYAR